MIIPNIISDAPAEFNDGAHMFAELGLNLTWRQVLEGLTVDDCEVITDVLKRRKRAMDKAKGIKVPDDPLESIPDAEQAAQPEKGGKKRGKSSG